MATYLIGHVKGAKGDKGDTGSAAGFGTPTASVDANVGTPSVTVTATGPDTSKVFDFAFHNMKGAKGDKGDKGDTGNTGTAAGFGTPTASVDSNTGTPSVSITSSGSDTSKVFDFQFHNLKGETGATGPTGPTGPADTTALNIVRSTSTDAYKTTKSYKVGDHVIYNNTLYKCTSACSAGSWATNSSHFQATTVTSAITDLNASLTQKIGDYTFLQTAGATSPSVINFPSGTKELYIEAAATSDPTFLMVHGTLPISVAKHFPSSPYWNFGNYDGTNRFYVTIDVSDIKNNRITVSWPSNVTTPAIYYR